jgi:tetratricopeptide (TPR) repeat protein
MGRRRGRAKERAAPAAGRRPAAAGTAPRNDQVRIALICAVLAIAIIAVYAPTLRCDYVAYDDDVFVTDNSMVKAGLTAASIGWAITTSYSSYWHPLTWLSYELDNQLFGLNAGPEHVVNVALHLASTLLLFFVLLRMTGRTWRCAVVAAIFALHPQHVESVAWIAERKDVLSTFFAMLVLLLYVRYVSVPSLGRYLQMAFAFAAALLAKPMVVTLPFVLLLLDLWPLGRFTWPPDGRKLWRLFLEKTPLVGLSAIVSMVTYIVQKQNGAMSDYMPISERLAKATVSYVLYLGKAIWPVNLAVFYPYRPYGAAAVLASALALAAITALVFACARRSPWLVVGWLWFIGTLVPVIGIVQVGAQAIADRYTYFPMIGLAIAIVWTVAEAVKMRPVAQRAATAFAAVLLALFAVAAHAQAGYWKDSHTLFAHALAVTRDNYTMQGNMGIILGREGRSREAIDYFHKAIAMRPARAEAYAYLGRELLKSGTAQEAAGPLERAVQLNPRMQEAQADFGVALMTEGNLNGAREHLDEALRLDPTDADSQSNLCTVLQYMGRPAEAETHCREALRLRPGSPSWRMSLAVALASEGKRDEAVRELTAVLREHPDYADARRVLDQLQRGETR